MSSNLKKIKLVLRGICVAFILLFMFVSMINFIKKRIKNEGNIETIKEKQYDFSKTIEELHLGNLENYLDYIMQVSKQMRPKELQKLLNLDADYVVHYRESDRAKQSTGQDILNNLYSLSYSALIFRVTNPNSDWEGLPLTDSFRSKYNENDSAIDKSKFLQHPGDYAMSLSGFNLGEKKFAMIYSQLEKAEWGGDYEQEYLDWYDFILDDGGYLDDILFNHTERIKYESYYDEVDLSEIES